MRSRVAVTVVLIAVVAIAAACAPPPPGEPPVLSPGDCFQAQPGSPGPTKDLKYLGPDATRGNFDLHESTDGTCTGPAAADPFDLFMLVQAADESDASATCSAVFAPSVPAGTGMILWDLGPRYGLSQAWICTPGESY